MQTQSVAQEPPDAHPMGLDDHDGPSFKVVAHLFKVRQDQAGERGSTAIAFTPEENERRPRLSCLNDEAAEIGIARDQDSAVFQGSSKHRLIRRLEESDIPDVHGIVPTVPEHARHQRRDVLVEKKSQAGARRGSSRSLTASAA